MFEKLATTYTNCATSATWLRNVCGAIETEMMRLRIETWEQLPSESGIVIRAITSDKTPIYIKASPPGEETNSAIHCLVNTVHPQLVRCLYANIDLGIHIVANVQGAPISPNTNSEDVLRAVGSLLSVLNGLTNIANMIPLDRWCRDLLHPGRTLPEAISVNIERCQMLLSTAPPDAWLHGDLHHANIIQNSETGILVAIDPKGIVGDPCFDICTFVRNHVPNNLDDASLSAFLERRIRILGCAAGYPVDRAFAWAAAGNALSLVWDLTDTAKPLAENQRHLLRILMRLNDLAIRYGTI
jgi:streptomycin 6-kinase